LHPELAPQEFKAFIREQTRPEALARRSSLSAGGNRVSRRASLLRGEYKPRTDDGVGESENAGIKRTASDGGRRERRSVLNFEELTIKDLQRLEELAGAFERTRVVRAYRVDLAFSQPKPRQKARLPARRKKASASAACCGEASA
jgi:hypothetical protein